MNYTPRRFSQLAIFALGLLLATANDASADANHDIDLSKVYAVSATDAERVVLVLYVGKTASHVPSGARMSMYRRRGDYISNTYDRKIAASIGQRHHIEFLTDWGISEIGMHCAVYRIPNDQSVDSTIGNLIADKRVAVVQRMATYRTMSHKYSDPYFDMQVSAKHFNLARAHTLATGRDITIAMIDTGVALHHPDLDGQVAVNENFAAAVSPEFLTDAHGTAVAGVIAAKSDNGLGIVGIAPDSNLIALKACWPADESAFEARCNSFTLALAMNTALRMNADVINLSLTGPVDPVLKLLIHEAARRGVIVVAAVPPTGDIDSGFPASMPEVIAVRSSDLLNTVSSENIVVGLDRTVAAPGHEILTTVPNDRYDFLSGSSLAAAQISGYIALIKQAYPNVTADETRQYLRSGSKSLDLERLSLFIRQDPIASAAPNLD